MTLAEHSSTFIKAFTFWQLVRLHLIHPDILKCISSLLSDLDNLYILLRKFHLTVKISNTWFPEKVSTYKTENLIRFINPTHLGFANNIWHLKISSNNFQEPTRLTQKWYISSFYQTLRFTFSLAELIIKHTV